MDAQLVGFRLKELREAAGLTQSGLAERAGVSQRAISHLEQGLHVPSFATISAIADVLGVSCEAFRQAPSNPPSPPTLGRPKKPSASAEEPGEAKPSPAAEEPTPEASADPKPKRGRKEGKRS